VLPAAKERRRYQWQCDRRPWRFKSYSIATGALYRSSAVPAAFRFLAEVVLFGKSVNHEGHEVSRRL
jgi:hypothetical protein